MAPERNETVRCWLRSLCGWQMRGNFIWARTANSGPNELWIRLWCVRLHKNCRTIQLKNPSQNTQVSITFLCQRPRKIGDGPAHFCFLRRSPEMLGTQLPAGSVHLPAIHQFLSDTHSSLTNKEQVQALSPASGRKVKWMSTPRGIKFDPDYCLFPKTCKSLGASWLWMLDKASTWSAYSGKQSCPAEHIFLVIHHHVFHGSEDKVSLLKWRFLKVEGLCRKRVIFQWKQMQLKTMGVLFLLRFGPICSPPCFSLEDSSGYPYFKLPRSWKMPRAQPDCQGHPKSLPGSAWVRATVVLSGRRFVPLHCGHPVFLQHPLWEPFL